MIYMVVDFYVVGFNVGMIFQIVFFYFSGLMNNNLLWNVLMGMMFSQVFVFNILWVFLIGLIFVFNGMVFYLVGGNWMIINFIILFVWNGIDNIVIVVDENIFGYNCLIYWVYINVFGNRGIFYCNDFNNLDLVLLFLVFFIMLQLLNI